MIGTRGIIFAGIIFHLTFRFIVCIFTVILAGFFLLRYAMPVRGVFLLYTPYCQVFRKAVASLATRLKAGRGIHYAEPDRKSGIAGKSK